MYPEHVPLVKDFMATQKNRYGAQNKRHAKKEGGHPDASTETAMFDGRHTRGLLLTLLASVGLFMVASGFGRVLSSVRRENHTDNQQVGVSLSGDGLMSLGLVNPMNETATGYKPTLTETRDCSGDKHRPVLAGADVVAYRRLEMGSQPVMGFKKISATYRSYMFFFATVGNMKTFKENPEAYVPAYGGFCSYGIAAESVWNAENLGPFADPSKWIITPDGELQVFRSSVPMSKFLLDPDEYVKAADARWHEWWSGSQGPMNTGCFCASSICADN